MLKMKNKERINNLVRVFNQHSSGLGWEDTNFVGFIKYDGTKGNYNELGMGQPFDNKLTTGEVYPVYKDVSQTDSISYMVIHDIETYTFSDLPSYGKPLWCWITDKNYEKMKLGLAETLMLMGTEDDEEE